MPPHSIENAFVHISGTSGYSRHGDTISLYAERIENLNDSGRASGSLALQLWACQQPYNGGNLAGWKLAELKLGTLEANHFIAPVNADLPASFPEHGDYAIVLVISEWDGEGFNLIHNYQNYPSRDCFLHPRFEGRPDYRSNADGHLVVDVERIYNPRDPDNMSGTLSLELWALSEPYIMGDFSGQSMAGLTLGTLPGGASWTNCVYDLETGAAPPETSVLVLMLREWTGNGYVTRDHFTLDGGAEAVPLATPAIQSDEAANADIASAAVQQPVQSPDVAAGESGTVGEPSPAADEEQATPASMTVSQPVAVPIAGFMNFAQRALKKIRQQLSL